MRTLYIDAGMGAAGDMLTAALTELMPDPAGFVKELNELNIPGVEYIAEQSMKCGITGTHIRVLVDKKEEVAEDVHVGGHSHTSFRDIKHIVNDHLNISRQAKEDIIAVYNLIAEAESHAHGKPIDQIHFHEVGQMDALADITAVCLAIEKLSPVQIIASPIHVGHGHVRCAHGILPVPAPATAYILKNVPIYGGSIEGELCTPTGAALLKHFVKKYDTMPIMQVSAIGYGMGNKDFEIANAIRVMIGESEDSKDEVIELSCNMDDITGEQIGYAVNELLKAGALDVYTIPIDMKKNRPGVLLRVMCKPEDKEKMIKEIFKHTTTIGIREQSMKRYVLNREIKEHETEYGIVREKIVSGYGISRSKYEYEDLARIAREEGMSLEEVRQKLVKNRIVNK